MNLFDKDISSKMKLSFVHCWISPGGALKLLEDLVLEELSDKKNKASAFKDMRIFTLLSDREYLDIVDEFDEKVGKIKIITSMPFWLNEIFLKITKANIPVLSNLFDYRNLMVFYPILMRILSFKIKLFKPERIIISSFAVAKNISFCQKDKNSKEKMPHIKLYLHSPMQYIRSHYDDYINKLSRRKAKILKFVAPRLRKWDKSFRHFDEVYANSKYTAKLAKEIYNIQAMVDYPKIENFFYKVGYSTSPLNYYIYVGRITNLVRETDTIVKLFNEMQEPLLILGSGPDEKYIKKIAKDNIIFLGRIDDINERVKIIRESKGLINLTKESFGIGTVESLLMGVPVLGLNDGATPELVDDESGVLVDSKDMESLITKFKEFRNIKWDREIISSNIRQKLKKLTRVK